MTTPELSPDHPAVKAALLARYGQYDNFTPEMEEAINAALHHLTAAEVHNVRNIEEN